MLTTAAAAADVAVTVGSHRGISLRRLRRSFAGAGVELRWWRRRTGPVRWQRWGRRRLDATAAERFRAELAAGNDRVGRGRAGQRCHVVGRSRAGAAVELRLELVRDGAGHVVGGSKVGLGWRLRCQTHG